MTKRMQEVLAYAKSIPVPQIGENPTVEQAMQINNALSNRYVPFVEAFMYAAALGLKEQEEIREMMHSTLDVSLDIIRTAAVEHAKAL